MISNLLHIILFLYHFPVSYTPFSISLLSLLSSINSLYRPFLASKTENSGPCNFKTHVGITVPRSEGVAGKYLGFDNIRDDAFSTYLPSSA